jgi:hypothetical protein
VKKKNVKLFNSSFQPIFGIHPKFGTSSLLSW